MAKTRLIDVILLDTFEAYSRLEEIFVRSGAGAAAAAAAAAAEEVGTG